MLSCYLSVVNGHFFIIKNIHIWVIDNVIVSFQKSQFAIMTDWQITKKTLNERCLFLFESGQWHDCEFIVGMESNQQARMNLCLAFLFLYSKINQVS